MDRLSESVLNVITSYCHEKDTIKLSQINKYFSKIHIYMGLI